jgi:hypothetical protein
MPRCPRCDDWVSHEATTCERCGLDLLLPASEEDRVWREEREAGRGQESEAEVERCTPSDVVLLRPGGLFPEIDEWGRETKRFVGQYALGLTFDRRSTRLFEGHGEYPCEPWAVAVVSTAFLGLERAQQIRLEQRRVSRWLGIWDEPALFSVPLEEAGSEPRWPRPSFEDFVRRLYRGDHRVSDIVEDWLGKDHSDAAKAALELARDGLVSRGLVRDRVVDRLGGLITAHRYHVEESLEVPTADWATELIVTFWRRDVRTWELLNREVQRGIGARQIQSYGSF